MIKRKPAGIVVLCLICFALGAWTESGTAKNSITLKMIAYAEKLIGLNFSDASRTLMMEALESNLESYETNRKVSLANDVPPALFFNPVPAGMTLESNRRPVVWSSSGKVGFPENKEELAFYSVSHLAELIRSRRISSQELTQLYLDRLKRYGPKLECVVTLTEELALKQARRADEEIAAGKYRGPLHGIPYGAKDLFSVQGYPTTWGTTHYRNQKLDSDASVIQRLDEAGAVLVAKLTLGELAWGDVWYGGTTKNPWKYEQGSGGSSAGSASATSAGLVAFAIGSETWGSIVSPSSRCGTTGLRPSYGRISRAGAMTLSWSMDKIGPICRTVEDCAIIFHAVYGPDGEDPTVFDAPFNYDSRTEIKDLKIGYLEKDFELPDDPKEPDDEIFEHDQATLAKLRELGADLIPIKLPDLPVESLTIILGAESAAAFDEFTRTGKTELMKRQTKDSWPNEFRLNRFVPAVEYIQANRIRHLLIQEMAKLMRDLDVYVAPSFKGDNLLLTNLTGHPCVVVPNGFKKDGTPTSISFTGKLFGEAEVLAVAKHYQDATTFHRQHPTLQE